MGSGSEEDEVKMASNRGIAVALEKQGLLKQDKIQVRRVAARAASGHTEESLSQALVEQGRRKDKLENRGSMNDPMGLPQFYFQAFRMYISSM